MVGHEWIMGDESNMSARRMAHRMKECIEDCLAKWTPRKRFTLYKNEPIRKIKNSGVIS